MSEPRAPRAAFGRTLRTAAPLASIICLVIAVVAPLDATAESLRFTGTAHDLKTDRLLYTEQYDVQVDKGRWVSGTTRYLSPSGQQIAEKKFEFGAERYVPIYTLDQTEPEYHEGITRIDKGRVELFMVRDGKRQTGTVDRVKDMVADCGAEGYVIDHVDALQSGAMLHFTLAVAGRTDSYALRASRIAETEVGGRKVMRVRVELDSLLRLVLPPLELTVDPQTRQLLEYSGIANLKDPATKKAYSARIVFTYP